MSMYSIIIILEEPPFNLSFQNRNEHIRMFIPKSSKIQEF